MPYEQTDFFSIGRKSKFQLPVCKVLIQTLMLIFFSTNIIAQTPRIVRGKIVDENNSPVAGATIQLKGTDVYSGSAEDGSFTISVSGTDPVLVISYVGYSTIEVKPGNDPVLIQLSPHSGAMDEVVIIGYGTQKRISVTGAVDMIGAEDFEGKPVVNLSQALQGVSPNLIIQQKNFEPGQGLNINIRGLGTLGSNSPLVVIDGIIGGDINLLNPNDIDNVSILKDAGAAAIYGSRSANGVILVTTKKGKKNAKPSVNYSGIVGMQEPKVMYEPVHAWENAYFKNLS